MSHYMEEAATLIRKVADANERENAGYTTDLRDGRMRCAQAFTLLAAIDKGLLPHEMAEDLYSQFGGAR